MALPGPFATVTLIVAPPFTVVDAGVSVGAPRQHRDGALVASFVYELLENSRTLYVPAVIGAVNWRVAPVKPVSGAVFEPFRYCHAT